jgi:hypothetical protein
VPRWLVVLHPGRQLGVSVEVRAGAEEPFVIRLEPTGTITGRLLDVESRPCKQQDLRVYYDKRGASVRYNHLPEVVRTGDDGRFHIKGVIPGLIYQIDVAGKPPLASAGTVKAGLVLKTGEVKDLGDVKVKRYSE